MTTKRRRFEAKLSGRRYLRDLKWACAFSSTLGRSMESNSSSMPFLSSSMDDRSGRGLSSYGFVMAIMERSSVSLMMEKKKTVLRDYQDL